MMDENQRKKTGDVLCDIGKYMLTVIPFSYIISDKPGMYFVIIGTAFFGMLFILFGLYFTKSPESSSAVKKGRRKIRILKNTVFIVEEDNVS
jgi:hypothetical protein